MSIKINKRQFKQWIAALDSGEYKQGTGRLHSSKGYCCLGVGCKVTIPSKLLVVEGEFIYGLSVLNQPDASAWLKGISVDFTNKTGTSLVYLNDFEGFTFPEIATLLELVYVHKILD